MGFLHILSVWIHILLALTWLGGMIFLILVVVPVRRELPETDYPKLIHHLGVRFRIVGWSCFLLLAVTGLMNIMARGYRFSDVWSGLIFRGPFGTILFYKLILVFMILVMSGIHDFWMGPKASYEMRRDPMNLKGIPYRQWVVWLARINLFLALVVTALAVLLARSWALTAVWKD